VTGDPDAEMQNLKLLEESFKINLVNPIAIINSLLNKISNNGSICVITSMAGLRGRKMRLHYCSAKAGLINYLSGLFQHLSNKNIHVVNCIAGYMNTETFNIKSSSILISEPEDVAKKMLNAIKNKRHIIYTNILWKIIGIIIRMIPDNLYKKLDF
jgi:decaprenylphospho-beta-D-erythro-pentofuranosid-2-ulose 2-reductase